MEFADFARINGLIIPSLFSANRIQRCATESHPHKTNGAYFYDGARGFVFDWAGDAKPNWFNDENSQPWTDAEKKAWAQQRNQSAVDIQAKQDKAAIQAQTMLNEAESKPHGYLMIKGFETLDGFVSGDELYIPIRNIKTNKLQTIQRIYWVAETRHYEKKMLSGGKAKAGVFILGNKNAQEAILCEGYATGLSIKLAADSVGLRACVIVCFSANNMIEVAKELTIKTYIFADNDTSNVGKTSAEKTGLAYVMSDVVGEDANDLFLRGGQFAVVAKLMEVMAKR